MTSGKGRPPQIKICGITGVDEAELAVQLGADLIGLNFHPPSPRCVTESQARSIAVAVDGRVPLVGVFVDEEPSRVRSLSRRVGLDLLQFHGSETRESIGDLASRSIRVLRIGEDSELPHGGSSCEGFWGVLFDTSDPGLQGGTGRMWNHALLVEPSSFHQRVFIAGGLRPDNIGEVLRVVKPYGVDVCSGVESSPGIKDPTLMRRFVEEIRNGEDRTAA